MKKNGSTGTLDMILEYKGTYCRCAIVIKESGIDIQDTEIVKTIDPMAEAFWKYIMERNQEVPAGEIEFVDENEYGSTLITGIRYKGIVYDIIDSNIYDIHSESETYTTYIELREEIDFSTKKWKNVFTSSHGAMAIDMDNKLWSWNPDYINDVFVSDINEIRPLCLNRMYPILNKIEISNFITDRYGEISPIFIDTNGKIYFGGEAQIICLNDLFPEQLGNLVAKEGTIGEYYNGHYITLLTVIDQEGKIWNISDIYDTYEGYKIQVSCINDNINKLNTVRFSKILTVRNYDTYSSTDEIIIGLDNNNKVWKIEVSNEIGDTAESITDIKALPNIQDISFASRYDDIIMLLGENNVLYEYNMYNNEMILSSEREDTKNLRIAKYYEGIIIDTNGDLWFYPDYNSTEIAVGQINVNGKFDNKKIKDVYGTYIQDVDNVFWGINYQEPMSLMEASPSVPDLNFEKILDLNGKGINKISGSTVLMVIDSEGYLHKYGRFMGFN